jgi:hypothetical protein
MEPEVVMNLWVFVQSIGPMSVIYELGVRPYMMSGSDDEMTALLKELSVSDFHFAERFPLPAHYHLKVWEEGGQLRASTGSDSVRPGEQVRKGLALVRPDIAGMKQMEYFSEALDAVEKALPTRRVGMEGSQTRKPTVNRRNLLSVITTVNVDDKGNQVAKVDDHRRSTLPEPTVNLWMFCDDTAKAIYALSGRGYMIHGSESERTRTLKKLATLEFSLAASLPVPDRFATNGTLVVLPDNSYNRDAFDDVYRAIDNEVPTAVGIDGKVKNTVTVATRQSMSIATLITEHTNKAADATPVSLV